MKRAGWVEWANRAIWLAAALGVALLAMRFGMRALGVRPDVPFPGIIYGLTAPLVEPFYRFAPASDRFDHYALEMASLLCAGAVVAVALALYVALLLITGDRRASTSKAG